MAEAEDLVLAAIEKAVATNPRTGQPRLYQLKDPDKLVAWVRVIAYRIYLDRRTPPGAPAPKAPWRMAFEPPLFDLVRPLLDQLSPDQQVALRLVGQEGFTYERASQILGVPIGTVQSRCTRGGAALLNLVRASEGIMAMLLAGERATAAGGES